MRGTNFHFILSIISFWKGNDWVSMKIIKIIKTDTINIALHTDAKVKTDVLNNVLTSKDKPKKKQKKNAFLWKGRKNHI